MLMVPIDFFPYPKHIFKKKERKQKSKRKTIKFREYVWCEARAAVFRLRARMTDYYIIIDTPLRGRVGGVEERFRSRAAYYT